jgi:hexokinase
MDAIAIADGFLREQGMHPDSIDIIQSTQAFIGEMKAGLEGRPSSLMMLPSYLTTEGAVADDENVIAVDMGGTNLRVALCRFVGGKMQLLGGSVSPMPGSKESIGKDVFFQQIAEKILPYTDQSGRIGVCFSHSAEILPNRDGRLLAFSKEISVSDSEGAEICAELSKKLRENGCLDAKSFLLLNDTTAVLLGGLAGAGREACHGMIGFVLGTGMNMSYIEQTQLVKKLKSPFDKSTMIINTESGCFSRLPFGAIDLEFDGTTVNPGDHLFEKMASGRYLGPLILLTFKKAASEGLFSPEAAERIHHTDMLNLSEVTNFLSDIRGDNILAQCCKDQQEREILFVIADRLIERAAKLSVSTIAAVIEKTCIGHSADKPARVIAEGSTFYNLFSFKEKFHQYIRSYINLKQGRHCRVEAVEQATILGTSLAALLNR